MNSTITTRWNRYFGLDRPNSRPVYTSKVCII